MSSLIPDPSGDTGAPQQRRTSIDRPTSIDTVSFNESDFGLGRTPRAVVASLIHKGVPSLVAATLAAVVVAVAADLSTGWITVVGCAVAAVLGADMSTVPAHRRGASARPAVRLIAAAAALALVVGVVSGEFSLELRVALLAACAAAVVSLLGSRLYRAANRRARTMLVGPEDAVRRLERQWANRSDVLVAGVCAWDPADSVASTVDSVVRDVPRMMSQSGATRVAIAGDRALSDPMLRHLAWGLQRSDFECLVVTEMNDYVEYVRPARVGEQLALVFESPRDHALSQAVKTVSERLIALVMVIALAPLMVIIAMLIRLDSPGPAIYRQVRSGKDGVPFHIFKFRSMIQGADRQVHHLVEVNEGAGPLFKLMADPRVTAIGSFLRRTSLDELPQLFNVLLGDMSLVGPRPALESETSAYSPWVWRRLHVKPGITGLWQVSGRSTLPWDESIRLDLKYVNNWSLWLDLRILARTVVVVMDRKGAW